MTNLHPTEPPAPSKANGGLRTIEPDPEVEVRIADDWLDQESNDTSRVGPSHHPMPGWERTEFASLWASAGVFISTGEGAYYCPRCVPRSRSMWIDGRTGAFACRVCRLMGQGVKSLRRVADLLHVPVVEKEKLLWDTFEELGHCPRAKQLAFIRGGRELKILVAICNCRDCDYCINFWFRERLGHFARRLYGPGPDCQPMYSAVLPEARVATAIKMVKRKSGNFVRLPASNNRAHLFATKPFLPGQEPESRTRWDDPIWEIFVNALADAALTDRKISSSQAWSVEKARKTATQFDPPEAAYDGWEPASFVGDPWDLISAAQEVGLISSEDASKVKQTYIVSLDGDPEVILRFKGAHAITTWAHLNEISKPNWLPSHTDPF